MTTEVMRPPPLPVSVKTEDDGVFIMPASVSQKRFWLLEQMSPGNTALNIPIALQLSGPLDISVLERALQAIVDRHEILRTRFELIDGEVRQVISPQATLKLERNGLGSIAANQVTERIRQEMDKEVARPLDFAHAPLLRVTLVELGPTENMLMLTAHHIVSDGWSNGLLVKELVAFYDAFLEKKSPGLPILTIQYADYVVWQEEWLKTAGFQKQLDYWKAAMDGEIPVLDFPTDFPRQTGQPTHAILESLLLPDSLTDSLKRFCQEEGVTLFMVFSTAYFALLHRYTGQNRLMIGTTSANRNKPELENLVGLFANILVLHSELNSEMTFRELLKRQRDQSLSSFANHEAPFELVMDQLQQRKEGRMTMQTHFLFQRAFMQPATCGDLSIKPLHSVSPGSTFELTFGIVERKEGIRLQMEYRTSLFQKSTISRLLQHFQGLLESAVANPETELKNLSLFIDQEKEQLEARLAEDATKGPDAFPKPSDLLEDFDRQIEQHFQKENTSFTTPVILPSGARLLALDGQKRLMPMGIPGDLYLTLPEGVTGFETVDGPIDATTPRPLYKTGFLGRNDEKGVELWGYADDFVRVQGFRFNLLAVAAQLRLHPDVTEVAVAVHPQNLNSTRIIAYVVVKAGSVIKGDGLRNFLKGKVSDFILPSTVAVVASLPRSEEGHLISEHLSPPSSPVPTGGGHVPMQALLHQQLLEVWQRILKRTDLTIDDNFFEAGGNSFLALRMMLELEKLCGRPLPLSLLLTGATIADLSHSIVESNRDIGSSVPMICIQPKGSRTPFFFLHGDWVGGGFYCHRLARELGEDQPFYAFPPFSMREPRIATVKEMAAFHIDALREKFPHGPYALGGYCIGATVATEVARQLMAEGETVRHLILIDPPLWGGVWLRGLWPVIEGWGDLRDWPLEQKIDFFDRTAVALSRWLRKPLVAKAATIFRRLGIKGSATHAAESTDSEAFGNADILDGLDFSTYFMSYRLHRMTSLSVAATLFLPESTSAGRVAQAGQLSKLDPAKYRIEMLPGNHTTCVTKYTPELAAQIRLALESSDPR